MTENFNISEFKNITGYAAKVRYAKANLPQLGVGSSRITFDLGNGTVLKLAKNGKGIAQNGVESDGYVQSLDSVAKVTAYDDDDLWIIEEKVDKVTRSEFKSIVGIPFEEFTQGLLAETYRVTGRGYKTSIQEEELDKLNNIELFTDMVDLIGSMEVIVGDLVRLNSYGKARNRVVLRDAGFTLSVQKEHYSKAKFESHEDEKIFSQELFDELCETYRDRMPGGLGDDTLPEDVDPHQLFMGVLVEFEHTHDPMTAMEIALDHLTEIPDYYDRLEEMEYGARNDGMLFGEDESKPLTEAGVVKDIDIDPELISPDVYNKLSFILKRKGYDVRGGLDVKELMMKEKERNAFNAEWIEELNKITGNAPKSKQVEGKSDKSILSKAVKELGVTRDPSMGGYILPNGLFLDLSEGSTRRTADHRTVAQFMPDNYEYQTDAMHAFMEKTGCIRWMPEQNGIYMRQKPTANQIKTIKDLVQSADDSIPVDFYSKEYGQEGRVYPQGTSSQKILGDINRFYSGNELSDDFLHEATGFYPSRKPLDTNSHRMHIILATLNMYKAMSDVNKRKMENKLKEAKIAVYVLQRYSDDFLIKLKEYANELRESEMSAEQLKKRPASKNRLGEFEDWKKSETKKLKDNADDDMQFFRDNGYLDEDGKFK